MTSIAETRAPLLRGRVATRAATPAALLALAGLVASGVVLAMEAAAARSGLIPASWHGMPGWMSGPLPGLGNGLAGSEFGQLFLAMCGCYLVVLAFTRRIAPALAIGAIVTLNLAFTLAPPLLSADVFGYIDWARIGAIHGLDPYTHGSLAATHDPVFAFMRWHSTLGSPYGPLFTLSSYAFAPLGVAVSFWILKAAAGLASLAIVALVWASARRLGHDPVRAAALFGLNPLVLVWALGGAHNDLISVAIGMGAVYLAVCARERAGGAVAVVAAAFKASSAVVFPFLLLGARRRRDVVAGAIAAVVPIALVAVPVFGGNAVGFLRTNSSQQQLVANASLPNQVSRWLGLGRLAPGVRGVAIAVLAVSVVWLLYRTWRGGDWISAAGWATLALLATSAWLMPWYVVWLIPLAAVAASGRLTLATLTFCAFVVAMRTPL